MMNNRLCQQHYDQSYIRTYRPEFVCFTLTKLRKIPRVFYSANMHLVNSNLPNSLYRLTRLRPKDVVYRLSEPYLHIFGPNCIVYVSRTYFVFDEVDQQLGCRLVVILSRRFLQHFDDSIGHLQTAQHSCQGTDPGVYRQSARR